MADSRVGSIQHRWTQWLALGGLVVSVLFGIVVPVYTDETAWRLQERAGIDGGVDTMLDDICGPSSFAHPPWFMMPVRWFSGATNRALADPLFIRGEGVACAVGLIALIWLLIGQLETNRDNQVSLKTLAFSLLGLGVLPYVLVVSRPEQPIVLAMTLVLLVAFGRLSGASSGLRAWAKALAITALAVVMLSYHVKGVLYAGLAGLCLLVSARGRGTLLPRLAGVATISALLLVSAKYWIERFKCPGDPPLADLLLNQQNAGAALLINGRDISLAAGKIIRSANPLDYIALAAPRNHPMSEWLLPGLYPSFVETIGLVVMMVVWGATIGVSIAALSRFAFIKRWRTLTEPRAVVAIAILLLILIWSASQLEKNSYEAEHILPSAAIFAILSLTLPETGASLRPYALILTNLAFPLAICSELAIIYLTFPPMMTSALVPGFAWRQPYSVSVFRYSTIRRDIAAARAASGMPTDRPLERPLLDELSYIALQDSHLPLHRLGVLSTWNGSIADPVRYLLSRNSDGIIVSCRLLSPAMRSAASRSGDICAISHSGLERLAASSDRTVGG